MIHFTGDADAGFSLDVTLLRHLVQLPCNGSHTLLEFVMNMRFKKLFLNNG
jgi:hypothetical protein